MGLFDKLFAKKTQKEKNQQVERIEIKSIENKFYLAALKTEIPVYYSAELETSIERLVEELSQTLLSNLSALCQASVQNAVAFIEATGESLQEMLHPEEEKEYIAEFMQDWNQGKVEGLAGYLDRWYTKEEALKIAQACKEDLQGKQITIYELHLQTAKMILQLAMEKYNFGNVYPAIKNDLLENPVGILNFMRPCTIRIEQVENHTIFTLSFENDWEVEHGNVWIIRDQTPIYVGQRESLTEQEISEWQTIQN